MTRIAELGFLARPFAGHGAHTGYTIFQWVAQLEKESFAGPQGLADTEHQGAAEQRGLWELGSGRGDGVQHETVLVQGHPLFDQFDPSDRSYRTSELINSAMNLLNLRDITLARAEYEVGREIALRLPYLFSITGELATCKSDRMLL